MDEQEKDSVGPEAEHKPPRPVLIVSKQTVCQYSMFLEHLLTGLSDESLPAALVCRPDWNLDPVVSPLVDLVPYPVFDLPFLWRQNRRILVERLEKFQPTVLHCLCESRARLTRHLAEQLNLPYILTVNSLRRPLRRLPVAWSRCCRLMVPAETIAADLRKIYPRFAERISRINIGTFVEDWGDHLWEPGQLVTLVTARPLNRADDFEILLKAVKRLVLDGYEFLLVVMGDGRAESRLRKMVRSLGLLWIVTLVPLLEPWRSVLSAGDIYVQPQPANEFDPLLLEAMSVGTAVAGCKGGVDDLIIDGQTGVVFDPKDELSIYGSLQRLFDRPEFARQVARGAQTYLRQNHSVSKMVGEIIRIYRDARHWYANRSLPNTPDGV